MLSTGEGKQISFRHLKWALAVQLSVGTLSSVCMCLCVAYITCVCTVYVCQSSLLHINSTGRPYMNNNIQCDCHFRLMKHYIRHYLKKCKCYLASDSCVSLFSCASTKCNAPLQCTSCKSQPQWPTIPEQELSHSRVHLIWNSGVCSLQCITAAVRSPAAKHCAHWAGAEETTLQSKCKAQMCEPCHFSRFHCAGLLLVTCQNSTQTFSTHSV